VAERPVAAPLALRAPVCHCAHAASKPFRATDGRRQRRPGRVGGECWNPLPLPWPSRAGAALPRGGIMAAVPGRLPLIEPMLATPTRTVPADEDEWAVEAKWDGAIH
jgi:hypothetical protein